MIEVTVKTLDSQNHPFTVEDDITVKEFKELISGKVNIPAETQRIIYCGRVLQDRKKLNEYDVNGKVVHLVQRAPPQPHRPSTGSGNSNTSRFQIPSPNQIYLGSMAYSADMMDAQRIPQLPLSQNLSNSRLNVARKMLRLANALINQLENQTTDNAANVSGTENNMDSLLLEDPIDTTPVLAAQVYVPAFGNVFDQQQQITSAVLSATDNFRNIGNIVTNNQNNNVSQQTDSSTAEASTDTGNTEEGATSLPPTTGEATNEPQAGNDASTENNASQNTSNGSNIARTTSLADLMDELNRIQTRLQPFMTRYTELMRTDPTFENETELNEAQRVFDRVSATMHALGHAYHALSDVICPFNRPTPRALLCRPTLVQHAVLQAGISLPVRVQAQVDVENITGRNPFGRPDGNSDEGSDESDTAANTESNQNIPQDETTNEETPETAPETGTTTASAPQPSAPSNDSNGASQTQETPTTTSSSSSRPQVTVTHRPGGGRNVDIIVAMSPDDDPITQGLGGPNQDLIQSLVHAVTNSVMRSVSLTGVPVSMSTSSVSIPIGTNGAPFISTTRQPTNFGNTNTTNANATSTNTTSTTTNASTITTETTSAANGLGAAGQNSQARGNTATLPTTSTQTPRSTPRPHVQLSPHSFRAFDPFLQCNSHHITGQNRNANRTGNGARSQTVREESPFEIVSVQAIPSRARSTSLPRELNRMHGGRTSRSNAAATAAASATATSASSSTPTSATRKNATNTEATQTSTSTLPSETILTLPTPINMEVDTFYDATEHEDGNENSDSGRTKQKVLLPTSNGESSSPPLPDVNIGTESWHNNVPSDWVSVVTRDCQVQRHETAQPPYSDAYLSSVPAKRRKVISCNKPQGTLPQVITESLRQAVLTTGLSQVAPIDHVVGAAGGDAALQAAYREELRQSIRSRPSHATPPGIAPLKRFPNASICFQKP
ncbi:large proline-rich protein bag6 isoform X2 [Chrysoperla carnea]|uniref:large proline-rich protein bag6 isoform X2 n=1 Tax=Chrysoperla carnea TaxID=189513 RepID=UPI001D07E811|nr:large proline-rich protein bag6 isoform X2 [Chrysoperla carnea]